MYSKQNRNKSRRAFSLLEVMVVLVIIAMVASIATVSYSKYMRRSRQRVARTQISAIMKAVKGFHSVHARYPSEEELAGEMDGGRIPLDPWGNAYIYNSESLGDNGFEVISYGADDEEDGEGENMDIVSWDLNNLENNE